MTSMPHLSIALAQMNSTVGDIEGNTRRAADLIGQAQSQGAQLIVFPELTVTGYPPEDLLLKTDFLAASRAALDELAEETSGIAALVGFPEHGDDVYNAAALLAGGEVKGIYRKMRLPNHGVFDERRYFQSGSRAATFELDGVTVGISVCEDIWEPGPPATTLALSGAHVIANLSASPYHQGKGIVRERMLVQRAVDSSVAIVYANCVGGQDDLLFDGGSVAIDQEGTIIARAPQFEEALALVRVDAGAVRAARLRDPRHRQSVREGHGQEVDRLGEVTIGGTGEDAALGGPVAKLLAPEAEVYRALQLGLHDYVSKNGFADVVLGLSGGIDSALVAQVAVDALGPERVHCVVMPSPFSTDATQDGARTIARNLGAELVELPIGPAMEVYETLLAPRFSGKQEDLTEENLQARIRGNLLMALSNKHGWLVLATGNKSELSVGYSTLYGDMAGGFAVIKDVFKGWVYRLVAWRNGTADSELVPASVLERAPSAELRHEQRDDDSLPPYEVLDAILEGYIERDLSPAELVALGHPEAEVERVIAMVDRAEYKRRQAPPGIRTSRKAFGRDRRLPITNRYESRHRTVR